MLDRERILAKPDALHGYERELRVVLPDNLEEYNILGREAARYGTPLAGFNRVCS